MDWLVLPGMRFAQSIASAFAWKRTRCHRSQPAADRQRAAGDGSLYRNLGTALPMEFCAPRLALGIRFDCCDLRFDSQRLGSLSPVPFGFAPQVPTRPLPKTRELLKPTHFPLVPENPMYRIIGADLKEYGPISADQLRAWIAQGRANAETKAKLEGSDAWQSLRDFPEFAALLGARAY